MVVFSLQIFLPLGKLLLYYFRKDVYLLYFAEEGVFLPSFTTAGALLCRLGFPLCVFRWASVSWHRYILKDIGVRMDRR